MMNMGQNIRTLSLLGIGIILSISTPVYAELLPAQQAFQFSVQSVDEKSAHLTWNIQPNYYLYQHRISVKQNNKALKLNLPKGVSQYDENFGHSQVYWNQLQFKIKVEKNQTYTVIWQGCAKDQICYAPQKMQFKTDAQGMVIQQNSLFQLQSSKPKNALFPQSKASSLSSEKSELIDPALSTSEDKKPFEQTETITKQEQKISPLTETAHDKLTSSAESMEKGEKLSANKAKKPTTDQPVMATSSEMAEKSTSLAVSQQLAEQATSSPENRTPLSEVDPDLNSNTPTEKAQTAEQSENGEMALAESASNSSQNLTSSALSTPSTEQIIAQDQHWLQQLEQHSFAYALLLFLGLGCLLAFTPCSLPMIPILSSLLVREHKGVKAWTIALVFVVSMASVYAVMGFIASHAGLSLQRWFQQPMVVMGFAVLFVIFALNLFGAFEIRLPNRIVRRLDHWQSLQQGGTLMSAGIMGVLSALLVGPCMTAPLAGVLLFIAQSEQHWQGAVLLFSMGFGMGIPLLLVSILGERALPKAGMWMNQVKVFFGFIMLALAVYFVRPLLPNIVYEMAMAVLALSAVAYILHRLMWKNITLKLIYSIAIIGALSAISYYHYAQYTPSQIATQNLTWQTVRNKAELQQAIAQAKGQKIIIDVYADWCVSCQPIKRIFQQTEVQNALQDYQMIQLDLSEYDDSHQDLLDELGVLGPPTVLFIDEQGQEIRTLRLTGSFKQAELMQRIAVFK